MFASLNIQLFTYIICDRLISVNEVLTNDFIIDLFVSILMLVWMHYEYRLFFIFSKIFVPIFFKT